jgi:ABC-2 type transport system permease protein
MISALLYLQFHSVKNRTVMRVKRLKQPKYLIGGIVGGLYIYFYFFRYLFGTRAGRQPLAETVSPENLLLFESLGALALLVIVFTAWIIPHRRAALAFTEAEVAFLFPAPISRRGLIHFKLLRSQAAILFTTFFLTLVSNRLGGNPWTHALSWWLILSTLNLHFLGASFARTMLLDRGITNWQRRLGVLVLAAVFIVVTGMWARRTLPALDVTQVGSLDAVADYARALLASGPLPYLLYPFRLLVRPYLAPGAMAFALAMVPALVLMLLHYVWVVRANVAFEEASVEASQKLAEKIAAVRAGKWQGTGKNQKGKRAPFRLAPEGSPVVALFWKNLLSAGQAFTFRVWITIAAIVLGAMVGLGRSSVGASVVPVLGMFAGMLLVWSVLLGPQVLRQDLRQDLALVDMLKLYPMRGWQIALGELLAPAVILTCIQWMLLVFGIALLSQAHIADGPLLPAIALGAAITLPMLNVISLQIPNAAVLLFPAWFQTGKDGPHGIEATGQRLIFMLGQLLVLAVALAPAAGVFVAVFFIIKFALGPVLAVPLASLAAAIILALEAAAGVLLLGWLFNRFDVAAEATP